LIIIIIIINASAMLRVVVRVIVYFQSPIPTKNRAVYSDIFTFEGINKSLRCLHMYYGGYDIKDSVSSCKHWKAHVGTCVQEKRRWLHPNHMISIQGRLSPDLPF